VIKIGPLVFPDDEFFNERTLVEHMTYCALLEAAEDDSALPFRLVFTDANGREFTRARFSVVNSNLKESYEKSCGLAKPPFTVALLDAKGRTLERVFIEDLVEMWLSKGIKDPTLVTYQ
jgi:hypothetical protein